MTTIVEPTGNPNTEALHPDHAFVIQGRRHARDVLASAGRIQRVKGDQRHSEVVSCALQLIMSADQVDGEDTNDLYNGLAGAVAWALARVPQADRLGLLQQFMNVVVFDMKKIEQREMQALAEVTPEGQA